MNNSFNCELVFSLAQFILYKQRFSDIRSKNAKTRSRPLLRPPEPRQHAACYGPDQASQRIVHDIIHLKEPQPPFKLREFSGAAAQKPYDGTCKHAVPHRFDDERQQISHWDIKKNIQKPYILTSEHRKGSSLYGFFYFTNRKAL